MRRLVTLALRLATASLGLTAPGWVPARAQASPAGADRAALVAPALARNPTIDAARERAVAARARTGPSGQLPDPMLSIGMMNVPVLEPGLRDFMTMTTVGVAQRLPYPGKLSLEGRAAEHDARA